MARTPDRFLAGDPLRGISAFGIFVFHAASLAVLATGYLRLLGPSHGNLARPFGNLLGPVLEGASSGVYMFFVLSGYLIARPFVAALVNHRSLPSIQRYLRNRVLRILPALWAGLALVVALTGTHGASPTHVIRVLTLTEDWSRSNFSGVYGQAWTLNVEARFYLCVPLTALVLAGCFRGLHDQLGRRARASIIAMLALVLGWLSVTYAASLPPLKLLTVPAEGWAFMPGVLLAVVEASGAHRLPDRSWFAWVATAAAVFGIAVLIQLPGVVDLNAWLGSVTARRIAILMATGGVAGGALLYQWTTGRCWRLLDNRLLRWLGQRSYSFYLLHYVILRELAPVAAHAGGYKVATLVLLVLALPVTAAAAEASYRLVERPFQRWRSRSQEPPLPGPALPA